MCIIHTALLTHIRNINSQAGMSILWYITKLNLTESLGHHQNMFFLSFYDDIQHYAYFGIQNDTLNFLNVLKIEVGHWVTTKI